MSETTTNVPCPILTPEPVYSVAENIDGYAFLELCKRECLAKEIKIATIDYVGVAHYTVKYQVLPKEQEWDA